MRDPPPRHLCAVWLSPIAAVALACCAAAGQGEAIPQAPDPARAIAENAAPAEDAPVELPADPDAATGSALTEDDLAHLIDQAVEARLAGIPR
ncbi:MAG: hypothetical protein ACKO1M_12630, partial [Planctomycetota bacterium]